MHWNHLNPLDSSGIQWTMTGLVVHWTGTGLRKVACSPPTWPSNWATGIHWTPLDSTGIHMDYVGDGKDLPRVCYMRYGGMPLAAKAEIMQSEYKNSRQVLSILSPEVLRFLDLEAQVSKVETDDQIGSDEVDWALCKPTWPSNWATGIHWTPLESTGIHMDYMGDGKDLC
ncbi:uncharacterized protein LACBIDRAFT_332471 [Laccaria bicolor S238N-H82]|uniref:Predicted protein n=1 Tax=Laccaria bicolor (strain S238N-H82 / ATCC MYA-4686) TaxID=486041 RepID=B0DSU3_LACBS|nr:uncharacterized protein LACBIDRAFT_332471 [Laccaria bicolor S238N-H82]EDR02300.1 predicted protein [Laccaria bicolor S238N-H82]|eukprot:XP_001886977.1 predicted protein [Laccaria bicolor S238N-H82]